MEIKSKQWNDIKCNVTLSNGYGHVAWCFSHLSHPDEYH